MVRFRALESALLLADLSIVMQKKLSAMPAKPPSNGKPEDTNKPVISSAVSNSINLIDESSPERVSIHPSRFRCDRAHSMLS
jgi:hypothetical protein